MHPASEPRALRRARVALSLPPPAKEDVMPSLRRVIGMVSLACASLLAASSAEAGPTRYPAGPLHSPMSEAVVARLQKVLTGSSGNRDAFVKIGDSNTANPTFLKCLANREVKTVAHL